MEHINPVFNRAMAYAGSGQTLPSTYSAPPKQRKVPPIVGEIIGKLGLRYRPSGQADLEAHAEALRLLAEDVADVPAPLLDAAAKRWARESKFMPRASELLEMSRAIQSDETRGTDAAGQQLQAHCDRLNAMKLDWNWIVVGKVPDRRIERSR